MLLCLQGGLHDVIRLDPDVLAMPAQEGYICCQKPGGNQLLNVAVKVGACTADCKIGR
jgi:hypothetical protein